MPRDLRSSAAASRSSGPARDAASRCYLVAWTCLCTATLACEAIPIASPQPPTPLQIATISSSGVYKVLTYNALRGLLVFAPPGRDTFVLKQTWRESPLSASSSYVTLQVKNASSLTSNTTLFYITREAPNPPQAFAKTTPLISSNFDSRLFRSKCCSCGQDVAISTFYWFSPNEGPGGTTFILSVFSEESNNVGEFDQLTIARLGSALPILCTTSNLLLYTYPSVNASPEESASSRRKRQLSIRVPTLLLIRHGLEDYVVTVRKVNENRRDLLIVKYKGKCAKYDDAIFLYQEYSALTVNSTGGLTKLTAFTLQHAASERFLAVDVLDTLAVNVNGGCGGLSLKEPHLFDPGLASFPDYRFFIRRSSNSHSDGNLTVVCAMFHRRYCLFPAPGGRLSLSFVSASDQWRGPSFMDQPFELFRTFARRAAVENPLLYPPSFFFAEI